MNLVINLLHINSKKMLNRYALNLDSDNILIKVISQVSKENVKNIVLIVNPEYQDDIKFLLHSFPHMEKISFKNIVTRPEKYIVKGLFADDFKKAYRTLELTDPESFFGNAVDYNQPTLLMEGSKLYKKSILDFETCHANTLVTFETKNQDFSSVYMMFIIDLLNTPKTDPKNVLINDFKYNYLQLDKIHTIIRSSQYFSENISLRHEYLLELLSRFEFSLALEQIKEVAKIDIFWSMLYLEFLEGYGYEERFIEYYKNNKQVIKSYQFTEMQKQMYASTFRMFDFIDSEQALVNNDIKEYLKYGNTDFKYVTDSIASSKANQLNLSYLLNDMILSNTLIEEHALTIFNLIENFEVNPYIKMKNIVDIANYFISERRIDSISQSLINTIFSKLHDNQELFGEGIIEIKKKYFEIIKISANYNPEKQLGEELSEIPYRKGKVAICITGLAKYNYEKNLELMEHFLSDLDADYFVQMWNVYEEFPALAQYKGDGDNDWSKYYLGTIIREMPSYIKRQANFEAVLPKTAELLFTKKFSKINKNSYTDVFGDKLKSLKVYDYSKFYDRQEATGTIDNLNTRVIKYLERYRVSELLEEYVTANQSSYEYVINIDVNTMLKSKVTYAELERINNNEIHVLNAESGKLGIGMTAAKIDTAFKVNNIWAIFQNANSLTPFHFGNKLIEDKDQDSMLLHLVASKISWYEIKNNLGAPYINKKIRMPLMSDTVKQDIETFDGDKEPLIKFFAKADSLFTKDLQNNIRYQSIKGAKLVDYKITEGGVQIDVSIVGANLKSLQKRCFHLSGRSDVILESTLARPRVYKQDIEFLKYDDEEIVIRKEILEKDLNVGKSWVFTILYHDYTLTNIDIEFDSENKNICELNKYGMKYINFEDQIKMGIATKSFFLKEMKT